MNDSSGVEQYNNNTPTSNNPSLNITSELDKTRVKDIFAQQIKTYVESSQNTGNSLNSYKNKWDKLAENISAGRSGVVTTPLLEEANKFCDILEKRLDKTEKARVNAFEAGLSLKQWYLRTNPSSIDAEFKRELAFVDHKRDSTKQAELEIESFRYAQQSVRRNT